MTEIIENVQHTWHVPYHWSFGEMTTKFFEYMKNEKTIYGAKCTACGKVIVPPGGCAICMAPVEKELIPVKDEGILDAVTIVNLPYPGQPATPPYAYGYIILDGANTFFMHMVGGVEHEKIRVGMRVKAVWNEERSGDFYDIKYFQPVE